MVKGNRLKNVLLDGGSGANVMSEELYKKLGGVKLQPSPFNLKMADQSKVHPLGIIQDLPITLSGLKYCINVVVIRVTSLRATPLLPGRPWL